MNGSGFWHEQCPKRGPGLSHAHSFYCVRDHTPVHVSDECCDCRARAGDWKPDQGIPTPTVRQVPDHSYVFTISGRCGRQGCGEVETAHARLLSKVVEPGECIVDHGSIKSSRLIADGGIEWSRCPTCGRCVEPKFNTTDPNRDVWLSPRYKARVTFLVNHVQRAELPAGPDEAYL